MPDIEPFGYLIRMLIDLGVATSTGPLGWADINGWRVITEKRLCHWELHTLKRLSTTYYAAMKRYQGSVESSPVTLARPTTEARVERLGSKIKSAIRQVSPG